MRRTLGLVAVALAAVCAAGGCGGSSERASVDRYLDGVATVQHESLRAMARAGRVYAKVSTNRTPTERDVRRVAATARTVGLLRARIAASSAPRDARRLPLELLDLLELEHGAALELAGTAAYLRAASAALRALAPAQAEPRRSLRANRGAKAQAAALDVYAAALTVPASRRSPIGAGSRVRFRGCRWTSHSTRRRSPVGGRAFA